MATKTNSLWSITDGQRVRYGGAVLAMAGASLFMFSAPLIGGYAIDVVDSERVDAGTPLLAMAAETLGGPDSFIWYLWLSGVATLLMTAVGGVFLYFRGRLAALTSEAIVKNIREELYRRLHHLQARYYDDADTGDLVQRCSSDVETLRVFLSSDVVEIGRAMILLLIATPILFWLDSRLAWVSLVLMPFLTVFAYVFFAKVKEVFQVTDEAEGAMTAVLQENLTGIRVVRAFARQDFEIGKFAVKNQTFRDLNNRLIRLMGIYWATSDFFALSQVGLVLFFGGFWLMDSSLSVGTLFTFMMLEGMVIWPVRQLGRVLTDTGKAVVSLGRINDILTEPEESLEPTPGHGRAEGEIVIEHLDFEYEPGRPVIRDLNLTIQPGECLAIVGAPGSGKSTLIRLLLRLYGYSKGSIRLDGHELAQVNRQWLRAQIGVVLQDPFLYSGSIEANLKVGRPDANREHILQACDDAAISDAIANFPDGYGALVGERGVTLSGGQRQRLALGRAFVKDPPVLVLDDSLSAVDTGTEQRILKALDARRGRHTTIIIAHRLSSVIHADRIMVLDEGRCVQLGDHATLAAQDGPYRRLCQLQGALDQQIRDDIRLTGAS
jgi:ATP-binding cassette subfamily B protein